MVNLINDVASHEKLSLYHPTHNHNLYIMHVLGGIAEITQIDKSISLMQSLVGSA